MSRSVSLKLDPNNLQGTADAFDPRCPSREVWNHVTGRWGGLILAALGGRTLRFSELRARLKGVSERMLALNLRELERDGMVERMQYNEVPPRVEYKLTAAGEEVSRQLQSLMDWLEEHVRELIIAHHSFEAGINASNKGTKLAADRR